MHRLVRNPTIQLVLSDIRMPGGDGRSLLAYLRNDLGSSIPFVLMTGQTGSDPGQEGLEPTAVLSKPIRLKELGRLFDQLGAIQV
ncbi:response regulator [Congregibacter sp.]|uniref:response regulator n=1 Tax=Congregibacter sp. TaxID=2744308 RepID=UPI003F6D1787